MTFKARAALAVVALLAAAGAVTVPAAPAGAAPRASCARNLPVTHSANWAQMEAKQTCGFSYRGWGDWAGKYRYGPYRSANGLFSVACDESSCQSHPDGSLVKGGYQVKRTGRLVTTFTTGARPALGTGTIPAPPGAAKACTQGGITYTPNQFAPSSLASSWSTNGCDQYQSPKLQDNGGSIHYGDAWRTAVGKVSTASSPNSYDQGTAWIRYKNTSGGQHFCFRVFPTRGTAWFPCDG